MQMGGDLNIKSARFTSAEEVKMLIFQQQGPGSNVYEHNIRDDFTVQNISVGQFVAQENIIVYLPPEFTVFGLHPRREATMVEPLLDNNGKVVATGYKVVVGDYQVEYVDKGLQSKAVLGVFVKALKATLDIGIQVAKLVKTIKSI
jgi:hypothetical protein